MPKHRVHPQLRMDIIRRPGVDRLPAKKGILIRTLPALRASRRISVHSSIRRSARFRLPRAPGTHPEANSADRRPQRSALGNPRALQGPVRRPSISSPTPRNCRCLPTASPLMTDIPRLRAGHGRRPVLVGLDTGRDQGTRGGADHDRADRSGEAHGRQYPAGSRRWPIRRPTCAESQGRQDRLADRHRRRPPDQRLARGAAPDVRSRRALHDADPHARYGVGPIRPPMRPCITV